MRCITLGACLSVSLWVVAPAMALAQVRPASFDQASELRVVGGEPAAGERLPVIVFLAATNGTAEGAFQWLSAAVPFARYIAVLPAGQPTTANYLPRFGDYVTWMEDRLAEDLRALRARHPVDPERIYLAGFSLGGDTSWALLARHPDVYRGAVVLGARSSARVRGRGVQVMRERGVRVAFAIGSEDQDVRRRGIARTHEAMLAARVPAQLRYYPGAHTLPSDGSVLDALFRFVMAPP
ncbi:MAG: alpha/beta fold hydrolase [Myxococcales bacterium]|nr:alpha/beta fold hydrolase [Myxococcales bacterium]